MSFHLKFVIRCALIGTALLATTIIQSCGRSNTNDIVIDVVPSRPIVITADFQVPDPSSTTVPPAYKPIAGPWTKFSFNISNTNQCTNCDAEKGITIVGIQCDITGFTITGEAVADSQTFSSIDALGYSTTTPINYIAHVTPGSFISAGGTFDGIHFAGSYFIQGLPSLAGSGAGTGTGSGTVATPAPVLSTYNYQIRMTFTGWYGVYDAPQARFVKTVTINTQ